MKIRPSSTVTRCRTNACRSPSQKLASGFTTCAIPGPTSRDTPVASLRAQVQYGVSAVREVLAQSSELMNSEQSPSAWT
jgi:hypothetical protein